VIHSRILLAGALFAAACAGAARSTPPLPALPFATDTVRAQSLRSGVTRRFIYAPSGPWAIHVLDVDLARCYSAVAVKGPPAGAVGRRTTSALLRDLSGRHEVIGGVNADFFLFTPAGVPTGAHISDTRVVTGPAAPPRPVLAFTEAGRPVITTLRVAGAVRAANTTLAIDAWNRASPRGLAYFDAAWGRATDTASSVIEIVLAGRAGSAGRAQQHVTLVDTLMAGVAIPGDGAVLIAGRGAPESVRAALRALQPGDTVRVDLSLAPLHPREAVGGRPQLIADSMMTSAVDSAADPAFAGTRHPRTAAGIARAGERLILVVVDGRQLPHSAGMTLRELATLMLALGARDAINLDGGGSTALIYADPDSAGALRVANRPSDPQGERAVGNALAVVRACPRR
jgi:hypothetical protein